jgi:hypothetical protein
MESGLLEDLINIFCHDDYCWVILVMHGKLVGWAEVWQEATFWWAITLTRNKSPGTDLWVIVALCSDPSFLLLSHNITALVAARTVSKGESCNRGYVCPALCSLCQMVTSLHWN